MHAPWARRRGPGAGGHRPLAGGGRRGLGLGQRRGGGPPAAAAGAAAARAGAGHRHRGDSSNALSDLLRREADIAIRHVKPEQPDLIARLVREATASFYASEDWVKRHGHPRSAATRPDLPSSAPTAQASTWPTCGSTACR
jgi:DNA-binding transcriptional LysR family regulator